MENITLMSVGALNLTPLVYGFVGLLAIFGALAGLWRGFMRQTVRTTTIVISLVIAYALLSVGYGYLDRFLDGKTMADVEAWLRASRLISPETDLFWIYNFDVHTAELMLKLPLSLVIMPVAFVACFLIISSAMVIVHKIICTLCGFRSHRNSTATRLLGMLLGLVQGVAVAGILLMPVIGVGGMAKDAVAQLNEKAPNESITVSCNNGYNTYVKSVNENYVVNAYRTLGINTLYESIATIDIDGEDTNMTELLPSGVTVAYNAARLKGADVKNLTPENEAAIKAIIDAVNSSKYVSSVLSETTRSLAYAYANGNLNIPIDEKFSSIIYTTAEIFHTSDSTNIKGDLDTLSEVFFILSRDGVFNSIGGGSDAMVDVLVKRDANGNTTVSRIVDTINKNERTKPLVTLFTKLSVSVMSEQIGVSDEVFTTYDNIKNSLNSDVLTIDKNSYATEEEYVAEVSNALDTTLKNNKIELEKDIVDTMAQYVADNFSEVNEITDEQVSDIILYYYDAYLEYVENGTIPD